MAIRKKLGNDPLARRLPETPPGGGLLPAAPPVPECAPEGMPEGTPLADPPANTLANTLADTLSALFPLPLFCGAAPRKDRSREDSWPCVLDEQFRRAVLALPTVFGRARFSPQQFADALAVLTREALLTAGLPPHALTLALTLPQAPPREDSLSEPVPLPTALVLLHGGFGAMQAVVQAVGDALHWHKKSPRDPNQYPGLRLGLRLEHLPHSGEFMLRLLDAAPQDGKTPAPRLLDRDRLWPAVHSLGLALARRGCRVFLFTAASAEFRIIAPARTSHRLAA
ncbi:MAG: hypothetical protein LDL30_08640 [Desulfovibrio sp.]|nr:hypothetical protein [Desulfovibrio sp.]MCA1985761.1 hypothetical protein [Desulfovibrio sp.]